MTRMNSARLVVGLCVGLVGLGHGTVLAQDAGARSAIAALLKSSSGTYRVAAGRVSPLKDAEAASTAVFVQADAYRRGQAGAVQVPIMVGAIAKGPWSAEVEVLNTAAGAQPTVLSLTGAPGRVKEVREVTLAPGTYAVAVAIAWRGADNTWEGAVAREEWKIPTFGASSLEVSPVVLGESVVKVRETGAKPFVFGPTNVTPAAVNHFKPSDKLHVALRVSGFAPDADAKPDVTVEYVFEQRFKDRYVFFNKAKAQELNAKTLSKTFDGHARLMATGLSIPLDAFPAGTFQLTVRVRDKKAETDRDPANNLRRRGLVSRL